MLVNQSVTMSIGCIFEFDLLLYVSVHNVWAHVPWVCMWRLENTFDAIGPLLPSLCGFQASDSGLQTWVVCLDPLSI